VFDVGANVGEYSYTFLRLGARVVALEPNPECCATLRTLGHKNRLTIRCEAVGERQGEASLFLGEQSGHSTVSEEWMERASKNDPGYHWSSAIKARMNTLGGIQEEYGTPDFVKIDVEGYESSVLRGMSFRPSALGFEFHAYAPEQVRDCLRLPVFDSGCCFNIVLGDSWEFVWPDWRDKNAIFDYTSRLTGTVFGDIYARFA
jgi:FkbM family methyltransferase